MIDIERIKFILPMLRFEFTWQAFFLLLLTNLAMSIRWSLLLQKFNMQQPILESLRYYLIGGFYGTVLPGLIGSDVVRLSLSSKQSSKSKALLTISILFERSCGIMVLLMMAATTAMFVPILLDGDQIIANVISWLAITIFILLALFLGIIKIGPDRWFTFSREKYSWKKKISILLGNFRSLTLCMLFFIILLSFIAHLFDILGTFFLAKALNIEQSFSIFLLLMPIVYVLTILPISIGGIGMREGALTFFLVKAGVLASDAILLAFVIYFNRVLVGLVGGLIQLYDKNQQYEVNRI